MNAINDNDLLYFGSSYTKCIPLMQKLIWGNLCNSWTLNQKSAFLLKGPTIISIYCFLSMKTFTRKKDWVLHPLPFCISYCLMMRDHNTYIAHNSSQSIRWWSNMYSTLTTILLHYPFGSFLPKLLLLGKGRKKNAHIKCYYLYCRRHLQLGLSL